jgi:hypothetical protein
MEKTVEELLAAGMRKAKIIQAGDPLPSSQASDALETLTGMIDAWSNEELMIPLHSVVTKQLVAGLYDYTIGTYPAPVPVPLPDNHIETPRPQEIVAAFIRDTSSTDYPLQAMDAAAYNRLSRKTTEARPYQYYIIPGWPLMTLRFATVPYADDTLHLELIQPLDAFLPTASLSSTLSLPPGYYNTLVYNLAIWLADEWAGEITPSIAAIATNGKKAIKRNNRQPMILGVDRAIATNRRGDGTYIIEQGP